MLKLICKTAPFLLLSYQAFGGEINDTQYSSPIAGIYNENTADDITFNRPIEQKETILTHVTAIPINAGINPAFHGYRLIGKILLGSNRCMATGVSAQIVTRTFVHSFVDVVGILLIDRSLRPEICTREYAPVYYNFSKDVIGRRIIVHNVERLGNDVDASTLVR